MNSSFRRWMLSGMVCASAMVAAREGTAAEPAAPAGKSNSETVAGVSGREIFLREWLPNDPRSHGGDGLGPVFNDTSCVSCHNQGGVGGGGAEAKNVFVITAVRTNFNPPRFEPSSDPFDAPARPTQTAPVRSSRTEPPIAAPQGINPSPNPFGAPARPTQTAPVPSSQTVPQIAAPQAASPVAPKSDLTPEERERKMLLDELRALHPGLITARSVVLHKSGTDPKYAAWRDQTLGLQTSDLVRNFVPPAGVAPAIVAIPAASAGGGFFAELAAQAQQSLILELQPPNDLLAEKGRSLLTRFAVGNIATQAFAGPRGPGRQAVRNLAAIPTQRNSIALFGAGLIDAIPNEVIEAAAAKKHEDFPEISGRVARLKDGQIGRFGWKAQKSNLHDFTMTACAVEIGLHVPDHPQAGVPHRPEYQPTGFDLNRDECRELVQFLKDLPAPARSDRSSPAIAKEFQRGELAFAKIGCAACHVSDLGEVNGIYSDLLVHDLGPEGGDSGSYGVFQPQSPGDNADDPLAGLLAQADQPSNRMARTSFGGVVAMTFEEPIPDKMIGAGRQEWRTPPLWGVRDSAPYLHDGRAGSLEQAVAFHGGEAQLSANRFFRLPPEEQASVLTFLRSLVAPNPVASASR